MIDGFCYLAEITAFNPSAAAEVVLRFSTGTGFTTGASDTPAHTLYEPVLEQAVEMRRAIFAPGTTEGRSKVGYGDLVILNPDAELDRLLPYAFDGRDVVVRRGPANAKSLSEFTTVFVGTMDQAEFSTDRITIKLRDRQASLLLPLQTTTYAGTNALPNGLEGVPGDLAGKPKPLTYGVVRNVSAPCCNTAKLIYQVHDGAVYSVDAVYDRGVALSFGGTYASLSDLQNDALQPASGYYKVYLAGGYFRLGSSPVGTITADVTEGDTAGDRTAAALFSRALTRMGVDPGDIRSDDLTTLDAKNSAQLGIWIDATTKASDVLDAIANTVGAWWGADAAGVYRIARLERPRAADVSMAFTPDDLIGPPARVSTADAERGLPAYRVTMRYARNYTPQDDLAGGVSDSRRAFLAEEWREASAEDTDVQTVHLLAVSLAYDSLFANEADAQDEAARRLVLRSIQRHRFEITVPFTSETAPIDLGDTVGLSHPRYGLNLLGDDDGQEFIVLGVEPDARTERLGLTLWGNSFTAANLVTDDDAFLVSSAGDYLITDTR